MNRTPRLRHGKRRRSGFTLLESMLASSLLFVITVAVLSAITAGQQNAYESHLRIAGTLAAEELMGRLSNESYTNLATWNNHQEAVGKMTDSDDVALPDMYDMIGRRVTVTTTMITLPNGVKVNGRHVTVQAFDRENHVVAEMKQFVPEPVS